MLDVKVIVGFSGCPGGTPTDTQPNWITYRWPPEYHQMLQWQWKEKVVPYWKDAAKYARSTASNVWLSKCTRTYAVYNPRTLMKLREAAGEEIGANCDLESSFLARLRSGRSHPFSWQTRRSLPRPHEGHCDISRKLREIWRAELRIGNKRTRTRLPTLSAPSATASSASLWKSIVQGLHGRRITEGILSIENEDPILTGEVGVERAAYVLEERAQGASRRVTARPFRCATSTTLRFLSCLSGGSMHRRDALA